MNMKLAFLVAASILLSSGLYSPSNAQSTPADGNTPGAGSIPQGAPDFGRRGGRRFGDGQDMGQRREQRQQRMLQKFDANHDGTIDDSERAKMRAAREEKMKQMGLNGTGGRQGGRRMGMDGAGMGGPGGKGGMTDEQRQARRQKMMERFDANHDGKIDETERSQMREKFGKMGGGHRRRGGGNWGGAAPSGIPGGAPGGVPGGSSDGAPEGIPGGPAPGGGPSGIPN